MGSVDMAVSSGHGRSGPWSSLEHGGSHMQEPTNCTECPHRQSISGACGHESAQALVQQLTEDPERGCPFAPTEYGE